MGLEACLVSSNRNSSLKNYSDLIETFSNVLNELVTLVTPFKYADFSLDLVDKSKSLEVYELMLGLFKFFS